MGAAGSRGDPGSGTGWRLVQIGQSAGAEVSVPSAAIRGKMGEVYGFTDFAVPQDEFREHYLRLVGHAAAGEIAFDIETYPFERVTEAWERQATGANAKIVSHPPLGRSDIAAVPAMRVRICGEPRAPCRAQTARTVPVLIAAAQDLIPSTPGRCSPCPWSTSEGSNCNDQRSLHHPDGLHARRRQHPQARTPAWELPPDVVNQMIHDELMLDGNARLNLATFVTTWMEPQAEKLMAECLDKNMIDKDEYPQTAELEMRCVNILSRLWNAPDARGVGLLDDRLQRGRDARRAGAQAPLAAAPKGGGKPADRPNIVMGINVQVCWEKFANYWDVEMRLVPMEGDRFTSAPRRP